MSYNTYWQKGIMTKSEYLQNDDSQFCIQQIASTKYVYSGDCILPKVESALVGLYDKLRDHFFPDIDLYYQELTCIPCFVQSLGIDSDDGVPRIH